MDNDNRYFNKADFDRNKELLLLKDKCDKYDYLIAAGCGVIGGLIDVFMVGSPKDSALVSWTDSQIDNAVKSFAKLVGWKPAERKENNVASAIGFLEKKFRVNYDQRHTVDVDGIFNMTTKNHHMMSLGHSPDIVGLFFSILNQFTATSTFIADGKVISINTKSFELRGNNFVSKLFCGLVNWTGHIMSDIAGSSGSRGQGGRGAGIVIPFFELFQLCKIGKFDVGKDRQDLATIAIRTFQEGYDFRYGLAMSIPVILTDLAIKFCWAVRHYYVDKRPVAECIPNIRSEKLRIMLLVGSGTLCCLDGISAGVKSGGNWVIFFTQLNIIAWFRLIQLIIRELGIRFGLTGALERELDSMRRINIALSQYLIEAKQYDIDTMLSNIKSFSSLDVKINNATDEKELRNILVAFCNKEGYELPWKEDFDEFMSDRGNKLVFR